MKKVNYYTEPFKMCIRKRLDGVMTKTGKRNMSNKNKWVKEQLFSKRSKQKIN